MGKSGATPRRLKTQDKGDSVRRMYAHRRNRGIPTADNLSLDADVIICAQYQLLARKYPGRYVVIATTNVKHLRRFAEAHEWQNIKL